MGRRVLTFLVLLLALASPAAAQSRPAPTLSAVFHDLFGPNGLVVDSEAALPDGSTHSAHFNSAFQSSFTQFNVALASQLTTLPLPSPASGFTYRFDATTGTFVRSSQSFGPDPHGSRRDHRPGQASRSATTTSSSRSTSSRASI